MNKDTDWTPFKLALQTAYAARAPYTELGETDFLSYWMAVDDLPLGRVLDGMAATCKAGDKFRPSGKELRDFALSVGSSEHGGRTLPESKGSGPLRPEQAAEIRAYVKSLRVGAQMGRHAPPISLAAARHGARACDANAADSAKALKYCRDAYQRSPPGPQCQALRVAMDRHRSDEEHWRRKADWNREQEQQHAKEARR